MMTFTRAALMTLAIGLIGALLLAAPSVAGAHEGEVHAAAAAGTLPPVVAGGATVLPAAPVSTPAVGAQPAAPAPASVAPAPVAAGGKVDPATTTTTTTTTDTTVDGGGGQDTIPIEGGGGDPAAAPAAAPAMPTGDLPFTGVEQTLLISLAGMFAPLGVLLYCSARRTDRRRHLAMPRFQWSSSPHA